MNLKLYSFLRPLLFQLPPEQVHSIIESIGKSYKYALPLHLIINKLFYLETDKLKQTIGQLTFPNPIGLAGGFDKNASMLALLSSLGFGFIEVGTVTPKAQLGNPKPRLFRFPKEKAILNRMGFNNAGIDEMKKKVNAHTAKVPLGINIGKNKKTPIKQAFEDYQKALYQLWDQASYFTLNISSPNTENLRTLQQKDNLSLFLVPILDYYQKLSNEKKEKKPIWIKLAPDLNEKTALQILDILTSYLIDGIIISNTTIDYSLLPSLSSHNPNGGISGKPLFSSSNQLLKLAYIRTKGKIPLIGSGGIFSANDAFKKLTLGASLIQVYTGLIYQGPSLVKNIKTGLLIKMKEKGYNHISEIIGSAITK